MRAIPLKPETIVVLGAYGLQGTLFILLFAAARAAGDWALNFQSGGMKLLAGAGAVGLLCSLALLVLGFRASKADRKSGFKLPLAMSLFVGVFTFIVAEVGIRMVSQPHLLGWQVGQTVVRPYDWAEAARQNLAMAQAHRSEGSYLVEHPHLGWAIGESRSSADGLYHSSAKGLRSDRPGRDYRAEGIEAPVVLLGDSFAFSEEVSFEDSLAAHLDRLLSDRRVLNFGVGGYGVDQAVLRFEQDALAWSPSVAVLTFIDDDLLRVGNTYVFLKTDWGIPLSKPRFLISEQGIELTNWPTLSPEQMYSARSIFELPHIERDIAFFPHAWKEHPLHTSRLLRYLIGRFPTWPEEARGEDEVIAVGAALVQRFVLTAQDAGVVPVVAYLATSGDLRGGRRLIKQRVLAELAAVGVEVHDLTNCLREAGSESELFMPGGHYSPVANVRVAECLAGIVKAADPHRSSALP